MSQMIQYMSSVIMWWVIPLSDWLPDRTHLSQSLMQRGFLRANHNPEDPGLRWLP